MKRSGPGSRERESVPESREREQYQMGELGLEEEMSGRERCVVGQRLGFGVPSPGRRLYPKAGRRSDFSSALPLLIPLKSQCHHVWAPGASSSGRAEVERNNGM